MASQPAISLEDEFKAFARESEQKFLQAVRQDLPRIVLQFASFSRRAAQEIHTDPEEPMNTENAQKVEKVEIGTNSDGKLVIQLVDEAKQAFNDSILVNSSIISRLKILAGQPEIDIGEKAAVITDCLNLANEMDVRLRDYAASLQINVENRLENWAKYADKPELRRQKDKHLKDLLVIYMQKAADEMFALVTLLQLHMQENGKLQRALAAYQHPEMDEIPFNKMVI